MDLSLYHSDLYQERVNGHSSWYTKNKVTFPKNGPSKTCGRQLLKYSDLMQVNNGQ